MLRNFARVTAIAAGCLGSYACIEEFPSFFTEKFPKTPEFMREDIPLEQKLLMLEKTKDITVIDPKKHNFFIELDNHLIWDSLYSDDHLHNYKLYVMENEIWAKGSLGKSLCGHQSILHGGFTAAMLDEFFGALFYSLKVGHGFTGNLNVSYRKPIKTESDVCLRGWVEKIDGRKYTLKANVFDMDGNLMATATALFIKVNVVPQDLLKPKATNDGKKN
eukprot:TRINITY_DN777966_c0_g1_i1.p1 TRINITY_DN777966_c0_g1~~TRINITY_DN777966_c0_g1_i1.p1  ORF type:complete len:219 (-),score=48.43 TRINITY_DN777966_c0_g1_i1:328-984(-)